MHPSGPPLNRLCTRLSHPLPPQEVGCKQVAWPTAPQTSYCLCSHNIAPILPKQERWVTSSSRSFNHGHNCSKGCDPCNRGGGTRKAPIGTKTMQGITLIICLGFVTVVGHPWTHERLCRFKLDQLIKTLSMGCGFFSKELESHADYIRRTMNPKSPNPP